MGAYGGRVMDAAERRFWGKVPPERRGIWGRFLRIKRGDDTQEAVREALHRMGRPISSAYYSDFESGKTVPNEDWQAVFERLYGERPSEPEPPPVYEQPDLSALIAVLDRQAQAIDRLAAALERERAEAPGWAKAVVSAILTGQLAAEPAPDEHAEPDPPRPGPYRARA